LAKVGNTVQHGFPKNAARVKERRHIVCFWLLFIFLTAPNEFRGRFVNLFLLNGVKPAFLTDPHPRGVPPES
jgi:hypothetical protein